MFKGRYALTVIGGFFVGVVLWVGLSPGKTTCGMARQGSVISHVQYGLFKEQIPQRGFVVGDSTDTTLFLVYANVDELFFSRITTGLKAESIIDDSLYHLIITDKDTNIMDGQFRITMKFCTSVPSLMRIGNGVRLSIMLSEPSTKLLLPVGAFYIDTGGTWAFVMCDSNRAERRNIVLGRKSPDYFEVLGGLREGDRVLTSTYDGFVDRQMVCLDEIEERWKRCAL